MYSTFSIPICLIRDCGDSSSIGFSRISRRPKRASARFCHRSLKLLAIFLTIDYLNSKGVEAQRVLTTCPTTNRRIGGMSKFLFRGAIAVFGLGALYLGSSQNARADDWGCKVILCLSNPGGATQYAQCRPALQKLWRWLARGKSFPTCSSAGFESSRPRYEPYYCNDGYRLTVSYADRRRVVSCVSTSAQAVNSSLCKHRSEQLRNDDSLFVDAKWQYEKRLPSVHGP